MTLSHEVLEMITDPFGNKLIAAALRGDPARRVNYLVEVCDPCLSTFYPVNGVPVSDFYTPQYFDPVCTEGTRYSFTGEIERPLQILEGGYVTFLDPRDSGLYQLQDGVDEPMLLADIAELSTSSTPLRIIVDGSPLHASRGPGRSQPQAGQVGFCRRRRCCGPGVARRPHFVRPRPSTP